MFLVRPFWLEEIAILAFAGPVKSLQCVEESAAEREPDVHTFIVRALDAGGNFTGTNSQVQLKAPRELAMLSCDDKPLSAAKVSWLILRATFTCWSRW